MPICLIPVFLFLALTLALSLSLAFYPTLSFVLARLLACSLLRVQMRREEERIDEERRGEESRGEERSGEERRCVAWTPARPLPSPCCRRFLLLSAAVSFAAANVARLIASSGSFYPAVCVSWIASVSSGCLFLPLFANSLGPARSCAVSCACCSGQFLSGLRFSCLLFCCALPVAIFRRSAPK